MTKSRGFIKVQLFLCAFDLEKPWITEKWLDLKECSYSSVTLDVWDFYEYYKSNYIGK